MTYYKVTANDYPKIIDNTSSPTTVYLRKNIEAVEVEDIETGNKRTEYHYEENMDFSSYDIIYMIGGNTFYLLKELKEKNLVEKIIQAINNGVIYIGSSAGSIILGKTIETALPYDENWVNLIDFKGLNIVNGIIYHMQIESKIL